MMDVGGACPFIPELCVCVVSLETVAVDHFFGSILLTYFIDFLYNGMGESLHMYM